MEKKEEKKSLLKQSIEQGDNGSFALDMMCRHQQYHGTLKETQYVLRGSLAACQYGTGLSRLDMARDYGIYKGDRPVMTCADCRTGNIHGFGSCMCPEKKYAGRLPMNGEMHPGGGKAAKLPGNESAHICVPRIKSGWKQAGGNTLIYTGEDGYVPALTDQAVLACQYGGIISIQSVPKIPKKGKPKVINKRDRITSKMMNEFGWKVSSNELSKINNMLRHYGITKMASIRLFMATCGHESQKGNKTLEILKKDGTVMGKGYNPYDRGAGYIQITGRDLHLKFLKTVKDSFSGLETAKYIARKYPWEAAGWFWTSKAAKSTSAGSINEYIKKYGSSKAIYLLIQYWVNGWPGELTQDDALDLRDGAKWDIKNEKLYIKNKETCRLPIGWKDRENNYNAAIKIFK